jgi:AcrR family transcriptional regulator
VPAVTTTSTRPLRRDAQENRDRIVAAARDAIAAGGIDVAIDEVARRAGVGVGTIYRRFPTKDDLVDAVLEDAVDELVALAEESLDAEDPWLGFQTYVERVIDLHVANRGLKRLFASRGTDRLRRRVATPISRLVARAQADGSLRADFTPQDMRLVFWSARGVLEIDPAARRRFLALLFDGLRGER